MSEKFKAGCGLQPVNHVLFAAAAVCVLAVLLLISSSTVTAQSPVNNLDTGDGSSGENVGLDLIISVASLRSGRLEDALETIDAVVAYAPEVAAAHTLRAAIRYALGDYEHAIADGLTALELDDGEFVAYFFMGHAAFSQGRYRLAREYYIAYLAEFTEDETQSGGDLVIYLTGTDGRRMVTTLIVACDNRLTPNDR